MSIRPIMRPCRKHGGLGEVAGSHCDECTLERVRDDLARMCEAAAETIKGERERAERAEAAFAGMRDALEHIAHRIALHDDVQPSERGTALETLKHVLSGDHGAGAAAVLAAARSWTCPRCHGHGTYMVSRESHGVPMPPGERACFEPLCVALRAWTKEQPRG